MSKVAVVTGGAAGIGKAVVERLSKNDYIVVIRDTDETGGEQAVVQIQETASKSRSSISMSPKKPGCGRILSFRARGAEPEDIAEAVAFLTGDSRRHITGQTVHVNGCRIMP